MRYNNSDIMLFCKSLVKTNQLTTSMKKQTILLLMGILCSASLLAQRTIEGTITSPEGDPLIGVNIIEKGSTNGTISDIDGNYSLRVSDGAIITMSYTGYEDIEFNVNEVSTFSITMSEGALLDEVVVTALGIERKSKALPYSVTQLEGRDMAVAKEINVGNALAGKVAGVNVSKPSTGPGGSTNIVIRGNGNIASSNQPLVVLDGVPINTDNLGSAGMWGGQDWGDGLSSVNADDIESYSILKGNTAAALYGSRADNGVILITTKKGTKRKGIGISFNSNIQYESILNNNDFQNTYGHGNNGLKPADAATALQFGLSSWGAQLDGSMVPQFDGEPRSYSDQGDNISKYYETGRTFTNSLAFTGGDENYNFRFSVTNLDNKGINPNSGVNRKTFSTNTSGTFGKWRASVAGSFVNDDTKNRPNLSDSPGNANYTVFSLPPSIDVTTLRGTNDKQGAGDDQREYQFNDNVFVTNPYWAAYQFENNNVKDRLFGNITIGYEILEGLTLQGKVGMDRFNERRRSLTPYGTAFNQNGGLYEANNTVREINLETTLRYLKNVNENIGLDILVGGNQQKNRGEIIGINGNTFNVPFLHSIRNAANQSTDYQYNARQINSVFGQVEVSLMNQLYITATGRNDWFSALTKPNGETSNNSIFYPSIGLSYDLAGASLGLPDFIDLGKVRAAYAQVGGSTDPYNLSLTYGIFGQGHLNNPLGGVTSNSVPADDLKPSTNTEFEFGFDVRLFKGRANLDLAVYDRTTEDAILPAAISSTSGFGTRVVNVGEVTNKGVEVLLNFTPIRSKDLNWDVSLNYSHNSNKVVSLLTPEADGERLRQQESRTRNAFIELVEGEAYSQVVGVVYQRNEDGSIFLDDNGLPAGDTLRSFGSGVHPNTIGLNNKFSYGNLTLGFLIDMKTGGVIYNATNAYGTFRGLHKNTLEGREGDPIGTQNYHQKVAFNISEEFIDDASFAKLREIVIGYRLPADMINSLPFESATLSFAARNLFTLWQKTDNIDPESTYTAQNGQGLEMFGVPVTRTYGLNLNVQF